MVKRYDVPGDSSLNLRDDGRYVKYTDYAALEEENKRLKEYEYATKTIYCLWVEGKSHADKLREFMRGIVRKNLV